MGSCMLIPCCMLYRAADAAFSRGGSKGHLAFGVTYLGPQSLPSWLRLRPGLSPPSGGVRTHKGPLHQHPPHTSACIHWCLVDGADVRHKNGQVHSFSFTCPCWLSIGQSCLTGQLTR